MIVPCFISEVVQTWGLRREEKRGFNENAEAPDGFLARIPCDNWRNAAENAKEFRESLRVLWIVLSW